MIGQRELDEDRVDISIGIERRHLSHDLLLRGITHHLDLCRANADLCTSLHLHADIGMRVRSVADHHHHQMRRLASLTASQPLADLASQLLPNLLGNGLAVNLSCRTLAHGGVVMW